MGPLEQELRQFQTAELHQKLIAELHDKRFYRLKNPRLCFFCPLCRAERSLKTMPKMNLKNYLQCFLTSVILSLLLFPLVKEAAFLSFFLVWALFEGLKRIYFRKEIPCPYCGFDAIWYKQNVPLAKRKVQEFWKQKAELMAKENLNLTT